MGICCVCITLVHLKLQHPRVNSFPSTCVSASSVRALVSDTVLYIQHQLSDVPYMVENSHMMEDKLQQRKPYGINVYTVLFYVLMDVA